MSEPRPEDAMQEVAAEHMPALFDVFSTMTELHACDSSPVIRHNGLVLAWFPEHPDSAFLEVCDPAKPVSFVLANKDWQPYRPLKPLCPNDTWARSLNTASHVDCASTAAAKRPIKHAELRKHLARAQREIDAICEDAMAACIRRRYWSEPNPDAPSIAWAWSGRIKFPVV